MQDILHELVDEYDFVESDQPDFILFGPYGNDIPRPGAYIRIGYFCELMIPDLSCCEWAFGVIPEEKVGDPRYKRIQWHGLDPRNLVKPAGYDPVSILESKKHFCNFLYANRIPYREEFFRQLSKYKKVDAPGKSMNNMPRIDADLHHSSAFWDRKRAFLSSYKFTIAFENYVYPGYQTEKLYDAMQMNSLPIYCGDPLIGDIFNTRSFVNIPELLQTRNQGLINWLEEAGRLTFTDILPRYHKNPIQRVRRKLKSAARKFKMRYQFGKMDFTQVIERIIELDKNDDRYLSMLREPWFKENTPPGGVSLKPRWLEIFATRE